MIVLFDGVCHLCQGAVKFIIARDPNALFKFAPLAKASDSIVLLSEGKEYRESDAALRIARHLAGAWKLFYFFILVPRPIRDAIYRFIARNRYRWFGKDEACWLPTPDLKARFLERDPR